MLLALRLRARLVLGELVFQVIEWTVGTDRHLQRGPVQRGGLVQVRTLQLLRLVRDRKRGRAFAERCGQPWLRMWILGAEVNVSEDGDHVELGSGRVVALDLVDEGSRSVLRAVPAGADGPHLVLW